MLLKVQDLQKFVNPLGRRTKQLPETLYHLSCRFFDETVDKQQKIFFLHHPKCGGTSIDHAIQNSFGVSNFLLQSSFFHLNPRASLPGQSKREYREQLLFDVMSKERIRYISGHFPYSSKAFQTFGHSWNFVTILRNPVSRWFSLYFFNRYKGSDHSKIDLDLESYLKTEKAVAQGRSYVRAFTDRESFSQISSLDQSTLDGATQKAIENLDSFSLVGVLEKLNVFSQDFKRLYGPELYIPSFNKNPVARSSQSKKVSDDIYQQVVEICQPSIQIYEHVLQQLDANQGWKGSSSYSSRLNVVS